MLDCRPQQPAVSEAATLLVRAFPDRVLHAIHSCAGGRGSESRRAEMLGQLSLMGPVLGGVDWHAPSWGVWLPRVRSAPKGMVRVLFRLVVHSGRRPSIPDGLCSNYFERIFCEEPPAHGAEEGG